MNAKTFGMGVAVTVVGVMVAGYLMNALRDNDIVSSAIDGFDA